ncbi:Uma2 family endonuclease [Streptomyces xiamenensis]|jgi:Uma2 family endonuclease|uniref:Uma2 family endonuclease n=1 Tax=Streptomyces xiamenensis TaxID=408015 RepID=UPI00344A80F5
MIAERAIDSADDSVTEPVKKPRMDPIDLLIALEEAVDMPLRPEFIEGMVIVPPQPGDAHNRGAGELYFQLRSAGFELAGLGNGFRSGIKGERTQGLLIPDFYVLRRLPSEVDEAYCRAHKGWYSVDLLDLVGEVTSSNHETDTGPKYRTYAAAGVPVYVLIHRDEKKAFAYSDPKPGDASAKARYATKVEVDLGRSLPLPEPYPALDTSVFLAG